MKKLADDLTYNFKKQDNGLIQLILINVIIFVVLSVIYVISEISNSSGVFTFILKQTHLPAPFKEFLHRPWTLIIYFFSHQNFLHILFNMLALYWFGQLIHEYLGNRRLINIYILGGIFGGIIYLILFNTVPFFMAPERATVYGLIGASGSVFAIAVAAATLLPHYSFHLIFIGPVKIIYIVAIYIFLSFVGSVGHNAGGEVCHLGGALFGYLYIRALQNGTDLGKPINAIRSFIQNIGKPKMKVTYRNSHEVKVDQKEVDRILDKISRSGYNSLTKEEKQILYKASQK
ncbi:MAG: rhomboid family intramembrane serine protease [Cytophagaceae bacterium]|nr:rhomboid family intramembrane serine protease [Cytophagaceae bacterium]